MAILDSQRVSIGMSDFLMGSQDYIIVIIAFFFPVRILNEVLERPQVKPKETPKKS